MKDDEAQVVRCPQCGQANRIPALGSGKSAVCGKCKAPLQTHGGGGHPVTVTDANFAETIRHGNWVIDFWAAWCGPCRMIGPIIDDMASKRTDVSFGKLNVDQNPRTSAQFGVQGIPLLIFFKDGAERGRVVGAVPAPQIEAAIARHLTGS